MLYNFTGFDLYDYLEDGVTVCGVHLFSVLLDPEPVVPIEEEIPLSQTTGDKSLKVYPYPEYKEISEHEVFKKIFNFFGQEVSVDIIVSKHCAQYIDEKFEGRILVPRKEEKMDKFSMRIKGCYLYKERKRRIQNTVERTMETHSEHIEKLDQ